MVGFSSSAMSTAERVAWYCALFVAVMLVLSCCEDGDQGDNGMVMMQQQQQQRKIVDKPCDEIYVVREGETLQTIGEKCGDPYLVEENPHIHDPDDVFPGLVIKITPFIHR